MFLINLLHLVFQQVNTLNDELMILIVEVEETLLTSCCWCWKKCHS